MLTAQYILLQFDYPQVDRQLVALLRVSLLHAGIPSQEQVHVACERPMVRG